MIDCSLTSLIVIYIIVPTMRLLIMYSYANNADEEPFYGTDFELD